MIEITTTATLREDLYERSVRSIAEHLTCGGGFRLLINIDPVGPGNADAVEAVARKYFDDVQVFRPDKADFQQAQLRLWDAVQGEFFLNIEDDWEFLVDVDCDAMWNTMLDCSSLALLRLPRWESTATWTRQWDKRGPDRGIPWNGRFFEIPKKIRGNLGFSGMPSLIRTDFVRPLLPHLDPAYDIEKQLKGRGRFAPYLSQWRYGVWQKPDGPQAIQDIGTPWRRKHKWRKDSQWKHNWHSWEKME
jgi:hypothetical protein